MKEKERNVLRNRGALERERGRVDQDRTQEIHMLILNNQRDVT